MANNRGSRVLSSSLIQMTAMLVPSRQVASHGEATTRTIIGFARIRQDPIALTQQVLAEGCTEICTEGCTDGCTEDCTEGVARGGSRRYPAKAKLRVNLPAN